MTKIIKGNLILDKDTVFDESLEVHGSILGKNGNKYELKVAGNITAQDIAARNIIAMDINADDINADDINAWNITAWNIDASFILCEKLEQKPDSTLTARKVINNRLTYDKSTIDNSQFIKQEACNAYGQVLRGKKPDKLSEKLK